MNSMELGAATYGYMGVLHRISFVHHLFSGLLPHDFREASACMLRCSKELLKRSSREYLGPELSVQSLTFVKSAVKTTQ